MYAGFVANDPQNNKNPESIEAIKERVENGEADQLTPEQQATYQQWQESMGEVATSEQPADFETSMADVPPFMPGAAETIAAGAIVGASLDALDPSPAVAAPADIPPEVARPKTTALEQTAANAIEQGGGINASDMTSQAFGGEMGRDAVIQQGEAVKQSLENDKIMASGLETKISQGLTTGEKETETLMASATAAVTAANEQAKEAETKAYFGDAMAAQSLAEAKQASDSLDSAKEALTQASTHVQNAEVAQKATNVVADIEQKQQEITQRTEAAQTMLDDAVEAEAEAEQNTESALETDADEAQVENEPDPAELAEIENADPSNIIDMAQKRNEIANKAATDEMMGKNQLNAA